MKILMVPTLSQLCVSVLCLLGTRTSFAAYDEYIGGCCDGKNELGKVYFDQNKTRSEHFASCEAKCDELDECVSFEIKLSKRRCTLSSTCIANEKPDFDCGYDLYIKSLAASTTLSPSSGPSFKFSALPTSMPPPHPTTLPTTLMNTLKSYNVTLDGISFNSSSFTLSTKFRTSDISNTSQSKMTLMNVGCLLTYRGDDPVLSVTDALPVILHTTTSLKANILEAEFQIDKFALASSLLTSPVGEYEKSTVGELKFCLKTEILSGTKSVNFRESDVVLKYNLSVNSFSVFSLQNNIEKLNIVTSTQIASNIYSISTCRCSTIGFGCLDVAETSQPLNQDSLIHICLSPNSSDVKIALFNMHFSKEGSNQIDFVTVTNSSGVTGFSVVRGNGVLNAPLKVTSRLFTELFANGAKTFDARGDAFLKFHSSARKLLSHVSDRNLQQDGADAGSALYKMSVPITRSETSEVDYKKGKFTSLIVGGFFTLVVLTALVTYKKVY